MTSGRRSPAINDAQPKHALIERSNENTVGKKGQTTTERKKCEESSLLEK